MALVIRVAKNELAKLQARNITIMDLCEGVQDAGDENIYTPVSGKLLDVVKVLFRHDVEYTLQLLKTDPS